jgi:hypothetical protein
MLQYQKFWVRGMDKAQQTRKEHSVFALRHMKCWTAGDAQQKAHASLPEQKMSVHIFCMSDVKEEYLGTTVPYGGM